MNIIATADLHIRPDKPTCRKDDFLQTQKESLERIVETANDKEALLIIAGDIFHRATVPQWLESEVISLLKSVKKGVYTVIGNHDVDFKNVDYLSKTSLGVLEKSGAVHILGVTTEKETGIIPCHCDHNGWPDTEENTVILIAHKFVYKNRPPFPGAEKNGYRARSVPKVPLVISGDNHQSFTHKVPGRVLVNPGSVTRQKPQEADYEPKIYNILDDSTVFGITLPDNDPESVSREHIEREEETEQRVEAMAEKIKGQSGNITVSFETNLQKKIDTVRMRKEVKSDLSTKLGAYKNAEG